ncbi:MAG TPA: SPOR domain-containing protein [Ignavibacteriaceae bacterium]|nr:SPOR domain-containing protein [Ignavibacteriaceae bacterium]
MKIFPFILNFSLFILLLEGCGASSGDRYEKQRPKENKETKEPVKTEEKKEYAEKFDFIPYSARLDIKERKKATGQKELDAWYSYNDEKDSLLSSDSVKTDTVTGFRVQVIATDNLQEADNIRSEIYFKTNQMNVYLVFEPPFYIVKAGDFINRSSANELSFKLNQMGYSEARVIQDSVIIHK